MQPNIGVLHADLLERICSLLDADSLAASRLVSRDWAAAGLAATCTAYPAATADFAVAERLTGLKHMHIRARCPSLTEHASLTAFLAKGPGLESLTVRTSDCTGHVAVCLAALVAAIATCTSLCKLHLAGVPAVSLQSISSLTRLTELHIKLARRYSTLEPVELEVLRCLKRLRALDIDVRPVVGAVHIGAAIAALPDLMAVALRTNSTRIELGDLVLGRQLTSFSLDDTGCLHGNNVGDVFSWLATCSQLRHLSIKDDGGYDDASENDLAVFVGYLQRLSTLQSLSLQPAFESVQPVWTVLAATSALQSLNCVDVTRSAAGECHDGEHVRECCSLEHRKQMEAALQFRTRLTSLRLESQISAWVHAGAGGALSKMAALRRLSINPGMQLIGLGQLQQLHRLDLQELDFLRSVERAEQLAVLGCLPELAALRLHFDSEWSDYNAYIDGPEPTCIVASVGDIVLQAVCRCTSLHVLHVFDICDVGTTGLAALPQLCNLASLVIRSAQRHRIEAADLATPLQHMPQLRYLDCTAWVDRSAKPRIYQLEGLPGRLLVRHPVGEAPTKESGPGFVGNERLAGLDY